MSPFKSGKLPVDLEYPSVYHKWRCKNHIVEKATDFGVCNFALDFSEEILKIDINFRHNFEFVRQLIFKF